MKNNYGAFIWKMKHKFNTQAAFCKAAGISANTLTNYINGKTPIPSTFINKACELLDIPLEEIGFYFFRKEVD